MATIREALRAWLAGDATISGLVATRIAPIRTKQREGQPSIVYRKISGTSPLHLSGRSNPQGIVFRVDCFAITELGAAALAKAVTDLVDGKFGLTLSGIFVQSVSVRDASDNPEDPIDGSDVGIFCESLDVRILYMV